MKNSNAPDSEFQQPAPQSHKSHWLPLLFFFLFLAGILYCCWMLWEQYNAQHTAVAEEKIRIDSLLGQKRELEDLLKLSPCEAAQKIQLIESTSPQSTRSMPDPQAKKEEKKALPTSSSKAAVNLDPDSIEEACVFLVSVSGPTKFATGSGFFIAPGYIITNRHVVGNNPTLLFATNKALGQPVRGRVLARGNSNEEDFAIVAVDLPAGVQVKPLKFSHALKKTQKVGAWGYPNIIGKNDPAYESLLRGENIKAIPEPSYSEGVVSAILNRDPKLIVHTAPISPGNSGGPLLDEEGNVVGINTMITLDEDSYRQASIALSVDDLEKFIAEHGISLP